MAVNYNDQRLVAVQNQKAETMEEVNEVYDNMINSSDKYYQAQVDATKQWEEKQSELQQERTDFTIEQIEQQKEQAHKDYTKEQSASYVDWQKQSNQYGANAEQMASAGLTNAGYSESSQVSMYNTYQNRVATAREVYNRAVLNYDNAIKDAQLQNNSILAEIAYNSLYQQLEISLAGFQYKNELVLGKLNTKLSVDESYHGRYMDVLGQINTENSLAEQIRQFNASLAEEQRQYNSSLALQQEQLALQKAKASSSGSSGGSSTVKKSSSSGSSSGTASVKQGSTEKEKDSTPENMKATGMKVGNVLSTSQANALGLKRNLKIVTSNGKYYAVDGGNYIDLTPVQAIISTNMKLVGASYNVMR